MNGTTEHKIAELQKLLVLNRIKILNQLAKEDTCVCKMVDMLGMKHNLISHHLKTLLDLGFITSNRNGQHIIYSLVNDKKDIVNELLKLINK